MGNSYLYEVNDFKEAIILKPQVFNSNSRNLSLFSVPQGNSVGTNDIGNAITLISFPKSRISYDKYFRNAVDDIGGGGLYIPVISPDVIGFGQVRTFVVYDFKKNVHREYRIVMSITKEIEKIAVADAFRRRFIFEIEQQGRKSNDDSYSLQLIDLSGEKPKLIREIDTGKVTVWTATPDKVFLYNLKAQEMQVLDMNLAPAQHPLAALVTHNKGKISFSRIQLHPYLPFAILYGGRKGSTFVTWGEGRDNVPHLLLNGGDYFSFSPDGRWVAFKYDYRDPARTYVMPVSEKYPHYLGSPIMLSNVSFGENNAAWTTNPVSFVASWLNEIYRWDLTNQAHPGSNKLSFHDYLVQQDLEKMAKEKR